MTVRTNSILKKILTDNKYEFFNQSLDLPYALSELIYSGFREEQDCILLKDFLYFGPSELESDFDKCSYEDFINDIHIDNYLSNPINEFDYLKIGLEAGKQLYQKLTKSFSKKFRLTISYNETTYDDEEIEVYGGCVIKFYTIRQSCEDKFRIDNLDLFEPEGVMVLD